MGRGDRARPGRVPEGFSLYLDALFEVGAEIAPREEARVASVEGILMAHPRSWVAVSRRGDQRLLTGLMEKHEKMAWMLRAFLAAESV